MFCVFAGDLEASKLDSLQYVAKIAALEGRVLNFVLNFPSFFLQWQKSVTVTLFTYTTLGASNFLF